MIKLGDEMGEKFTSEEVKTIIKEIHGDNVTAELTFDEFCLWW
jgi:Ca2+-binding EF-hand superfamily protein